MLLIVDSIWNFKENKSVRNEMVDSIYEIKDLQVGKRLVLRRMGGELFQGGLIIEYKFLEDKLIIETRCTRYNFTIIYN